MKTGYLSLKVGIQEISQTHAEFYIYQSVIVTRVAIIFFLVFLMILVIIIEFALFISLGICIDSFSVPIKS